MCHGGVLDLLLGIFIFINIIWAVSLLIFWGRYDKNKCWEDNQLFNRSDLGWLLDTVMVYFWILTILVFGGYLISKQL